MSEVEEVRAHVAPCLREAWGREPELDDEGDFMFAGDRCSGIIRIEDETTTIVSVFAIAADYVDESPALYEELNVINTLYWGAKAYFSVGYVVVHFSVPADGLTKEGLDYVVRCVRCVGDKVGAVMEAEYGGVTPIRPPADDHRAQDL